MRRRPRISLRPGATAPLLLLAAGLIATTAHADEPTPLDADVIHSLRKEAPGQVATFLEAERLATTHPDRSIALYGEVGRATTVFSEAHRRACLLTLRTKTRGEALLLCREAKARQRTPANVAALALVQAWRIDGLPLDEAQARALSFEALGHADADAMTRGAVCGVTAELDPEEGEKCARGLADGEIAARTLALSGVLEAAIRAHRVPLATKISEELILLAPDDESVWAQAATLAANRRDVVKLRLAAAQLRRLSRKGWAAPYFESLAHEIAGNTTDAARTLVEAERAGLSPEEVEKTRARRARAAHAHRLATGPKWALGIAFGSWLVLLGAAWGVAAKLGRRLEGEFAFGAPLPRQDHLSAKQDQARLTYGLSLRALAVLTSELWWSVVSTAILLGLWQPWRLLHAADPFGEDTPVMGALLIGLLLGTVWRYVYPPKQPAPGLPLPLGEHRVLAGILAEVAEAVSAPPIVEVYLTNGDGLSVVTPGSLIADLRGKVRPRLIVGAELLRSVDIQAFRALLAQAHAQLGADEIPGGRFALGVRARGRVGRGVRSAERSWDPARVARDWADRLFDRVSQTAVRCQALRGDRLAVAAYGYDAFERGLSFVAKEDRAEARPLEETYRDGPRADRPAEVADRLLRVARTPRLAGSEDFDEDARRSAWLLLSNRRALEKRLAELASMTTRR